jgi:type II secretory pathway pseudopilin PulG
MKTANQAQFRTQASPRGFTLLQLTTVMAVIAILATILLGAFGHSHEMAVRAQCDTRIKAITMALDAFRQENGHYPDTLQELVDKKYLTDASMLRCPGDPRPDGSYNDFYIARANRDSDELPILVCPLCEGDGHIGVQAFKGRYTKQFATRPASLTQASGVTVERPGKDPIAGKAGMLLRGGDSILTASGGSALLTFADGSESQLGGSSEITVLQSFVAGHTHAPLYTLIRQKAGDIVYRVHHGSKFDVSTPTATAGALGTEFEIRMDTSQNWYLKVWESKVYCSIDNHSEIYTPSVNGTTSVTKLNNDDTGFGAPGGSTEVTQTDAWIPIGQSKNVQVTAPDGSTTTTQTKDNNNNYDWWRNLLDRLFGRH